MIHQNGQFICDFFTGFIVGFGSFSIKTSLPADPYNADQVTSWQPQILLPPCKAK